MQYSRFPARVRSSDGSVDVNRAAVVVIDHRAEVAVLAPHSPFEASDVTVIATLEDVSVGVPDAGVMTLTGEDGVTWEVSQGDGCGCRSALSSWFADRIARVPMGS